MAANKLVYYFGPDEVDGDASMRDLLGGKGANLAEMSRLGLPVPPGFTITTDVCNAFLADKERFPDGLAMQVESAMKRVAKSLGSDSPLLVSVRSGGRASMPGMMDTVLNLGLNAQTVAQLAEVTGDARFAWDSYRRFMQMYGDVVMNVPHDLFEEILDDYKLDNGFSQDSDLEAEDWQKIVELYRGCIETETQDQFPDDPTLQLWGAIAAVFKSWNNNRAKTYRRLHNIPDEWGTAVTVQAMVFGNLGETSATGVCFTRNPSTGENTLYGEFLPNAQGEDVVAGIRTPYYLSEQARIAAEDINPSLEQLMPELYQQLVAQCRRLEGHFRDMQDIEFTIQRGTLYVLQTRAGKRTIQAGLKIAVDLHQEGVLSKEEALMRINPQELDRLLHPTLDERAGFTVLTRGLPASPGAASGKVVFFADDAEAAKAKGESVILVRMETSPEDIHGMYAAAGILTSRGGMTSHAAVVARGLGRACVSGATALRIDFEKQQAQIDGAVVRVGDIITIDGSTGRVISGRVSMREPELTGDFATLMAWADEIRDMQVRANAETILDAQMARKFGAEGIGLCRTEHMFFDPQRISVVRQMILAEKKAVRLEKLDALRPFQEADFLNLFRAMDHAPITIRLLDPPLHEFLPRLDSELDELAELMAVDRRDLDARMRILHEENPMLGHRGCRLAITMPEIYEMQIDAIFSAISQSGYPPASVEVMMPLTMSAQELSRLKRLFTDKQTAWQSQIPNITSVKFGTMIETPRAALTAAEIAPLVDFVSFGSNDLTQMTLGVSRDDSAGYLEAYVVNGLLVGDPFVHLDQEGVGQLMRHAVTALGAHPSVKIGLCGEHGGDPESIRFMHEIGLNYVSCSPYRLPIARLSAAQAVILEKN